MFLTVPDVIRRKRDGGVLTAAEIEFFVQCVVNGSASDAQIGRQPPEVAQLEPRGVLCQSSRHALGTFTATLLSNVVSYGAWLMAVYLNGMNDEETANLTRAMINSGERLEWETSWSDRLVDKHSTGGVGDKISLILAPALAACGLKVPMLSGRGLGMSGGTLDKLESIPGFQVLLSHREMRESLEAAGCFIAGQTEAIAPADGILYRHRDQTHTVDSIPLIASSILSKKAVGGARTLVMDIKVGCGSFLKNDAEATELGRRLLNISKYLNIETSVVVSNMDVPIGRYVGNALEVAGSIECLRNEGSEDVMVLVRTLGGVILREKGLARTTEEGKSQVQRAIVDGTALSKFQAMIQHQGVSRETAEELCRGNPWSVLPSAKYRTRFAANQSGVVTGINAADVARACWNLGSGRSKAGEDIDHAVGVKILKSIDDEVKKGEDWIEVHHSGEIIDKSTEDLITGSLTVGPTGAEQPKFSRILKFCISSTE